MLFLVGALSGALVGLVIGIAWRIRPAQTARVGSVPEEVERLREPESTQRSVETKPPGRFDGLFDLMASIEAEGSSDFLGEDWRVNSAIISLHPKIYALHSYIKRLGFADLVSIMEDHGLGVDVAELNYGRVEYLLHFVMPEIKRRVQAMKGVGEGLASSTVLEILHPSVRDLADQRFLAGHFADAVEAALKEVNARTKAIVIGKIGQELDGARLMSRAFSLDNPVIKLADLSSESGRSTQVGYLQIFSGAMTGIRNPKAHANVAVKETEAIHLLFLASLLMYRLEESYQEEPEKQEAQNSAAPADG